MWTALSTRLRASTMTRMILTPCLLCLLYTLIARLEPKREPLKWPKTAVSIPRIFRTCSQRSQVPETIKLSGAV